VGHGGPAVPAARLVTGCLIELISRSAEETSAIGTALAGWLRDGDVVLLHGDLGAGKTTLAKGIAAALGVAAVVSSPSFALVNEYDVPAGPLVSRLYHLDLYRLQGDELDSIGFADFAAPADGATLVEWPERAADALPDRYLLIELTTTGTDRRRLQLSLHPPDGAWDERYAELRARLTKLG